MRVKTGSYTGTGSTQSITGVGFAPDLVWSQDAAFDGMAFRTASMAATQSAVPWTATANETDCISSLDTDGFTVETDAKVNGNAKTYYYLAVKSDGASDFRQGTYTGNGVDSTNITIETGFQPDFIMIKGEGATNGYIRTANNVGDQANDMSDGSEDTDVIQAFNSDGFQVGANAAANSNNVKYYYFAFKNRISAVTTNQYTGNATDNTNIVGLGFPPDFVLVQRFAGGDSKFQYYNSAWTGDNTLDPGSVGFTANVIQTLLSGGFQIGTDAAVNGASSNTYNYLAIRNWPISSLISPINKLRPRIFAPGIAR